MGVAQTAALGAVVHSAGEEAVLVPVPPVPFPMHASVLVPVPASALVRVPFLFFCLLQKMRFRPPGYPRSIKIRTWGHFGTPCCPKAVTGAPQSEVFVNFGAPLGRLLGPGGLSFPVSGALEALPGEIFRVFLCIHR